MQVETPEISYHNDIKPVLAVDIHPSGRMATGGADHMVRVWQLNRNNNATDHADGTTLPAARSELTFLANLEFHEQPVNAVRFSPDGKYLASASDDHWVVIWQRVDAPDVTPAVDSAPVIAADGAVDLTVSPEAPAVSAAAVAAPSVPFGADPDDVIESTEKWVQFQRMRGHVSEIYDLCWAPNSKELTTGSIDSHTLVWNLATGTFSQTLKDHSGYVQGVCWDPLNQYLATQSSDRSVKIYERKRNAKSKAAKPIVEFVEKYTIKNRKTPRLAKDANTTEEAAPLTPKKKSLKPLSLVMDSPDDVMVIDQENRDTVNLVKTPLGVTDAAVSSVAKAPSTTVTRTLFMDDTHPSYFRRLAFSPDGSFLLTPAGQFHSDEFVSDVTESPLTNLLAKAKTEPCGAVESIDGIPSKDGSRSSLPTCYMFHRSDFSKPIAHLPQLDPVVVIKFCPKLYQLRANQQTKEEGTTQEEERAEAITTLPYRMVFAIATTKHILLYDTESSFPLCVVKNIHHTGLTDLAWSADGCTLISSSSDGYCSYIYLSQDKPEIGDMLPEEEMELYRQWWNVRRDQISSAILSEDGGAEGASEKKKKKKAATVEAKTAIVTLLGAEPAPLPSWTPTLNADGSPSAPPTSSTTPVTSGAKAKRTMTKRGDDEIYTHAIELMDNNVTLSATRLQNDLGIGPQRSKKVLEGLHALLVRTLGQFDNMPTPSSQVFEEAIAAAFGVDTGVDLRTVPARPREPLKPYSAVLKVAKVPTSLDALVVPASLDALKVHSIMDVVSTPPASLVAPTSSDLLVASSAPISPVPTAEVKKETVIPASPVKAAASSPAQIPQSPMVAAKIPSAHSTPAKVAKSPAAGAPNSSNKKKRKAETDSGAKPKTTIMDMFKKAASKPTPTSAAKVTPAASSADVVDLTTVSVSLSEVPLAQPRAKRRITPQAVVDKPQAPAAVAAATATPVPAVAAVAPAAISVDDDAMDESGSESEAGSDVEYQVEKILKKRTSVAKGTEYLIKWVGFDSSANTWEPEKNVSDDAIATFEEKSQKTRRRVAPTLVTAAASVPPAVAAATSSPASAAAAAVAAPAAAAAPFIASVNAATSIASLSPTRKRKPSDEEPTSAVAPSSASSTPAPDSAVHQPAVKKAKRKIAPVQ